MSKIYAEVSMGEGYLTCVEGDSIEEVVDKIRIYHSMCKSEQAIHERNGTLKSKLESGWYFKEEQK